MVPIPSMADVGCFFCLAHFQFSRVSCSADNVEDGNESDSAVSSEAGVPVKVGTEVTLVEDHKNPEMTLLDLYSGCGAMSTGLCLGANMSGGLNLVTVCATFMFLKYACF